jgi:hypothetical protein
LPNTAARIARRTPRLAQRPVDDPLDELDPVVPPAAPLVPLVPEADGAVPVPVAPTPLPLVPPGVALVEPLVLLVLFVAPAPMPAALRVVVMSVEFIELLVVDWQPAASAAARHRPNKAVGRKVEVLMGCSLCKTRIA